MGPLLAGKLHSKEYDVALANSIEEATEILRRELAHPFVENIEKTLQNLNLGDQDDIYLIEEELTAVLLRLLENKISEVLNLFMAQENVTIANELAAVFAIQDVKVNLTSFFENLQVAVRENTSRMSGEGAGEKDRYEKFTAWNANRQAIVNDLEDYKVRYRRATHGKLGPLAQSVGLTLGIGILWYFVTLFIYKVILFVVYGHTKVRKAPV